MHFFDFLGGDRLVLNVVLLAYCFLIIAAFVRNKVLKLLVSLVFSVFIILQLSSLYLIQTLIDYRFVIHLNSRDIFSMLHLYNVGLIIFTSILWILLLVLFYKSSFLYFKYVQNRSLSYRNKAKAVVIILFFLSLVGVSKKPGVIPSFLQLIDVCFVENNSTFIENQKQLGIDNIVSIDDLDVSSKNDKNIIILSLESFESGYLSDHFSHLTPNLTQLKHDQNWSYLDIEENEGSNWTSGSIYTTLTGLPAYFGGEHNSLFQSLYGAKIPSVLNILNKLNHKTIYLTNEARFSGTDNMLFALGIDEIIDEASLGKNSNQDKDLFEAAKQVVQNNETNNQKYTLYLSTFSTHNPNGVYDKRMEKIIEPQKNDLEFMVSAVDYLVGDFLLFLKKNNFLNNTQVFILPDHLKHGSGEMFNDSGKRGLYLMTNKAQSEVKFYDNLVQLDLPKLILELADISHNHTFLSEQIAGDKKEYIEKNLTQITRLNISGFSDVSGKRTIVPELSQNYEKYKKDTSRFIAHGGGAINGAIYTNSLEALDNSYKKGFRLFELDFRKTSDGKIVAVHEWEQWADFTNSKIKLPASYDQFMNLKILNKYSPLDMDMVNHWFSEHKDAVLITDKINTPKEFSEVFQFKNRLMMELFSWEAIDEAIEHKIIPIVSENVVFSMKNNIGDKLRKKGVKHAAISRKMLRYNSDVFQDLQQNGIKTYAFHINADVDKNEEYAVKYEMDYYYGIYADNWFYW